MTKTPTGIRKRDNRYYATYPGPDGRQVEESAGTSIREARAFRARRVAEVAAGTWRPRSDRQLRTVAGLTPGDLPSLRGAIGGVMDEEPRRGAFRPCAEPSKHAVPECIGRAVGGADCSGERFLTLARITTPRAVPHGDSPRDCVLRPPDGDPA